MGLGARRIALTGGIATGKSRCLDRFAALGAAVIDADRLAHDALDRGTPGLAAVVARFGAEMLRSDGSLDRGRLARVVFADDEARRALEAIVHPVVYARIAGWLAGLPAGTISVADIPLLYETGRQGEFDCVIVAACPRDAQLERLRARGMSPEDAERRLQAQLPIDQKARLADEVIDTSGTLEETDRQVAAIWDKLRNGAMRQ